MAEKNKAKIFLKRVIDFIKASFVLFVRCGRFLIYSIENFPQVILVLLILFPISLLLIIHFLIPLVAIPLVVIPLNIESILEAFTAIGTITVAIIAIFALNFTRKQLHHSRAANRNERAAKAIEMLENESEASDRMALYIFKDLIWEDEDAIKCMQYGDILADWIRKNQGLPDLRKMAVYLLGVMPEEIRIEYRFMNEWFFWPDLQKVNLQGLRLDNVRLQGADLRNAMLQRADFNRANLERANLDRAILIEAELRGANLRGARFWRANLKGVDLEHADLRGAVLRIANLHGACLGSVDLQRAQLQDANLKDANLCDAYMKDANLIFTLVSGAKMKHVKGLTKEQIMQATWKDSDGLGEPPQLPEYLLGDPDVQKWLESTNKLIKNRKSRLRGGGHARPKYRYRPL